MASLVAQTVKNPPAMQETWVQSLGQEDPLEKEMATHSLSTNSCPEFLPGKNSVHGLKETDGLQSMVTKSQT